MSVINQMLQDLDKRKGRSGGVAAAGEVVRSVLPQSPLRSTRTLALAIFGLGLVMLATGLWLRQRNASIEARPSMVAMAPPAAARVDEAPRRALQVHSAAPVPVMVAAEPVATVKTPAAGGAPPPQVSGVAAVSSGAAQVAPVAAKVVVTSTAPALSASANALTASDEVEAPPTKTAAASPKAANVKTYSAGQLAANLLAEAARLDQQGHQEEAKAPLERLLAANPLHVRARQLLAQLQLDTGRIEQARQLLAEGQRLLPEQSNFTLTLARLQVDSGDAAGAIQLLEADPAAARDEPQFHAFLAALLLRAERHEEAVQHYLVALRSEPSNASWLVGAGVALEGVGNYADAAAAYRRAEGNASLTSETANFLSERLARLRR